MIRVTICLMVLALLLGCSPKIDVHISGNNADKPNKLQPGILKTSEISRYERIADKRIIVGQLMIVAFRWDSNGKAIKTLGPKELAILNDLQPGGVALFAANLDNVAQTRALIRQIQDACIIPPFIAIDEEGGRVSRLGTSRAIRATHIPSAASLAKAGSVAVWNAYNIIGSELNSLGINMDFAPIADIDENPDSAVVGDRSFGSDPLKAAEMVRIAVNSLQEQNVCAVLKHYPGHGRSTGDSHLGKQIVQIDWKTLWNSDLIPFRAAIDSDLGAVMTAHIEFPLIDNRNLPVSMSDIFLRKKLRQDLSFNGLIITDALDMRGILTVGGPEDVAVASLKAGVDMLLCPETPLPIRNAILQASLKNIVDNGRIRESFHRILSTKNKFGILGKRVDLAENAEMEERIGSKNQRERMAKSLD